MTIDGAAERERAPRLEQLGTRLRASRRTHGLTMREVAARTGISQPFLSQIERGQAAPSLTTMFTLAELYGVTPEMLLADDVPDVVDVIRSTETPMYRVTDDEHSAHRRALIDGSVMTVSEYLAEPGDELGGFYESKGVEFINVLEGGLIVEIEDAPPHHLRAGDSIRYPSHMRHRWKQDGPVRTRFVHVITGQDS
ncbi:helix-turn-helix domain-containing protein [Ilumatobacter coccineus]|uniref:Putative Xre family DNA-binding protein n=1 Tax=Ilumatobacter coccineus (strain NBRC 103263 / KCTC 29153 / YM16-304) TaxID=1313172 RepID=A0A6C7E0Y8_ILUCY|nr:XRE family transcriptional regulator [Ilumatobacter coccineus]BAN00917.1 putative Xre family DNA-binding protein [Ilumatobacter coccineus YM16-304]